MEYLLLELLICPASLHLLRNSNFWWPGGLESLESNPASSVQHSILKTTPRYLFCVWFSYHHWVCPWILFCGSGSFHPLFLLVLWRSACSLSGVWRSSWIPDFAISIFRTMTTDLLASFFVNVVGWTVGRSDSTSTSTRRRSTLHQHLLTNRRVNSWWIRCARGSLNQTRTLLWFLWWQSYFLD